MAVYICFGTQNNFKGWLIRKVTDGPYSHTWIEYNSKVWGDKITVHAQASGVLVEPARLTNEEYISTKRFMFEDYEAAKRGLRATKEYIGRPYDYKAILCNSLLLVAMRLFPFKKVREWLTTKVVRDTTKYSCSEYVTLVIQKAKILSAQHLDAETMTPTTVAKYCESEPAFTES